MCLKCDPIFQIESSQVPLVFTCLGRDGSFLVRESTTSSDCFALSVRQESRVTHIMIRRTFVETPAADSASPASPSARPNAQVGPNGTLGRYRLDVGGGHLFDTLAELVQFYREHPMVLCFSSLLCSSRCISFEVCSSLLFSSPSCVRLRLKRRITVIVRDSGRAEFRLELFSRLSLSVLSFSPHRTATCTCRLESALAGREHRRGCAPEASALGYARLRRHHRVARAGARGLRLQLRLRRRRLRSRCFSCAFARQQVRRLASPRLASRSTSRVSALRFVSFRCSLLEIGRAHV